MERGCTRPVYVGRTPNNDIALPDESVSKVQAFFQLGADGIWLLHDADSTNGTRVGEQILSAGKTPPVGRELAASADLFD